MYAKEISFDDNTEVKKKDGVSGAEGWAASVVITLNESVFAWLPYVALNYCVAASE